MMDNGEPIQRVDKATEDASKRGRRALDAIRGAGYAVTPIEPSREMIIRGQDAAHKLGGTPAKMLPRTDIATIWRAMLKAIDDAD